MPTLDPILLASVDIAHTGSRLAELILRKAANCGGGVSRSTTRFSLSAVSGNQVSFAGASNSRAPGPSRSNKPASESYAYSTHRVRHRRSEYAYPANHRQVWYCRATLTLPRSSGPRSRASKGTMYLANKLLLENRLASRPATANPAPTNPSSAVVSYLFPHLLRRFREGEGHIGITRLAA